MFQKTLPETLTDIQRAVRFYYCIKTAFGAKVTGQSYGYSCRRPSNLNLLRVEEDLSNAHIRLSRVNIENLHYNVCVEKYDSPDTFFYLDPPYYDCENDYGKGLFAKSDFQLLAATLAGVKGKFLLSINDIPEIRDIFQSFNIDEVQTTYSIGDNRSSVAELFISNYVNEEVTVDSLLMD